MSSDPVQAAGSDEPAASRAALLARLTEGTGDVSPLALPSARLGPDPAALTSAPRTHALPGRPLPAAERRLERVGIPAAALAGVSGVALVGVLIAVIAGWSGIWPVLLLLALAVLTVVLAGTAWAAGVLGHRHAEPKAHWESDQPWIGPLGASTERRLVTAACRAAERISTSPAWSSPTFDDHRLTLDLRAELTQIDSQAYALAARRVTAGEPVTAEPVAGSAEWTALLDHLEALARYADRLTSSRTGAEMTGTGVPSVPARPLEAATDGETATGAVRDEFATAHLRSLTADLAARAERPDSTG